MTTLPPASAQALRSDARSRSFYGTWFHAPQLGHVEVLTNAIVVVNSQGVIESVLRPGETGYDQAKPSAIDFSGFCLLPGFVDLHVHAPQYPQLGLALDAPVEVWLGKYTFPLEARYADLEFARLRYSTLVQDLLANGTTTALYFATVDLGATKLLVDLAISHRQRALIGKVAMDNPETCPSNYRDACAESAVMQTRELIDYVRTHPQNKESRVLPVITPRFIPSCTDSALQGLGALAATTGCHVQTHCSESDWAHGYALARCGETDTAALDRVGLLGRRTVLAHSNFITPTDMEIIAGRRTAVAHCPVSNAYFASAVFPLRHALERGITVGLGSDISGGPISSIFEAARHTVQVSRLLETGVDASKSPDCRGVAGSAVSIATAFYLATTGGGSALDLPIGKIAPGYRFDVMAIDPTRSSGGIRLFGEQDNVAILEKILYTATRTNVVAVWVDGLLASTSLKSQL